MFKFRLAYALSLSTLLFALPAAAQLPKVALVPGSSSTPPDVQKKLQATGAFASVDVLDALSATPSLATLKKYDAVLVWSYVGFANKDTLGNNLADYVDQGGGVVMSTFEAYETGLSNEIGGRYAKDYNLMAFQDSGSIPSTASTLGTVLEPGSSILTGVKTFGCKKSCGHLSSAVVHGGTVVAKWADGNPLVIRGAINGHSVVDLNFFPASDDLSNGEWDHTTDGATLMKNALLYVMGGSVRADKGALAFADQGVGTTSASQELTYTNTAMMGVTLQTLAITGANAGDFTVTPSANLPVTLASGATFKATVTFSPKDIGPRSATLEAAVMGETNVTRVALSGVGLGPTLTITPSPLDLGGVVLGDPIKSTFKITNTGGGSATVKAITVTADAASFAVTPAMSLPITLSPGGSLDVAVAFASDTPGKHTGEITIASQLPDKKVPIVAYTGDPAAMLSTSSISFGKAHVNAPSMPTKVSVTNSGFSDLTVSAVNVSGKGAADYKVAAAGLPVKLKPSQKYDFTVTFTPSALGTSMATVSVTTDAPKMGVVAFDVVGEGVTFMETIAPTMIDFGKVKGGTTASQKVVVTNQSGAPLTLTSLTITGTGASQFSLKNPPTTPSVVLPNNNTQTLTVVYTPTILGAAMATLTIGLDDPDMKMVVIQLVGTGVSGKLDLSASKLEFGGVIVGDASAQQAVTITNSGTDVLKLTQLGITGAGAAAFSSDYMTSYMVPVGGKITFNVSFQPNKPGSQSAVLQLTSDDPTMKTVMIALHGVGTQPMISVDPLDLDFGVVPVMAQSPDKIITITNSGDADLVIATISTNSVAFVADPPKGTVKPGGKLEVKVHFVPRMAGIVEQDMTISPAAGGLMDQVVHLRGTGVTASLSVMPMALSWPIITVGKSGDAQTVTITNTSKVQLVLGALTSTSKDYTIDGPKPPIALDPNKSTMVRITFTPSMGGPLPAKVLLLLKDGTMPVATIRLDGEGLVAPMAMASGCAVTPIGAGAGRGAATEAGAAAAAMALLAGGLLLGRRRRAWRAAASRR